MESQEREDKTLVSGKMASTEQCEAEASVIHTVTGEEGSEDEVLSQ